MTYLHKYKPNYAEWLIRGGTNRKPTQLSESGPVQEGFTNGPYTVGESPVEPSKRSPTFDFSVFDGDTKPQWCGTKEECDTLADKWNDSYAMFIMARGTAAELELYGDKP